MKLMMEIVLALIEACIVIHCGLTLDKVSSSGFDRTNKILTFIAVTVIFVLLAIAVAIIFKLFLL